MSVASPRRPDLPETSLRYPGWRVVGTCAVMAVYAWGFGFYGHGFYLAELKAEHGWPTSLIAGATTAFYLFSAVLGAFVGDVIERVGARTVILTGIVLTGCAASLIPAVSAPWQLFAAYALMAFGWAATSLTAITTVLGAWFGRKRGLAISIGLTGASFGGIVVVPLLTFASREYGFGPAVWFVVSGLGVPVALTAFVFLRADAPFAPTPGTSRKPGPSRRAILGNAEFWSVSAPFAMAFFAQVGFLVHQIALLEPVIGRGTAGIAVAVTTATAVGGRLVLGAFVDRLDQRLAAGASFFSQAIALCVVWMTREPVALIVACAAFGFSVGNIITLPALIIGREFPESAFAAVVGLSNAVCQIAFSFGPALLGALRDAMGGYGVPLLLCVALDVLASGAIVLARPPRPRPIRP